MKKYFPRYRNHLLLALSGLLLIALVAYQYVLPRLVTERYNRSLAASTKQLHTVYGRLEKSTEQDFLYDSSVPSATAQAATSTIRRDITTAWQTLNELDASAVRLPDLPLIVANGDYQQARISARQTGWLTGQSREVLASYERLLKYLAEEDRLKRPVMERLDEFNNLSDLNELAGQGDTYRQIAGTVGTAADQLERLEAPTELTASRNATVRAIRQAAGGFSRLATALDTAIDSEIYGASAELEAAANQLNGPDSQARDEALRRSPVLEEIGSLNEKLQLIEP